MYHKWRYTHPDILKGRRNGEACLPPNPKLIVPGYIELAVGGAVVKAPAYHTPWLPAGLKGVNGNERCRTWKICGGGRVTEKVSTVGKKHANVAKRALGELKKRWGVVWGLNQDMELKGDEWKEELRKTWATVVGLLAYEVEGWSECCMRGD